jgi:hypothetical protein
MIKMFLKAPHWVQSYKQPLPHASLPPEPVPTRWRTWIDIVASGVNTLKLWNQL